MKLSVHLVTWNGAKYIPYLFASLRLQTFRAWELLVVDNNSEDDTVALIWQALLNFSAPAQVLVNRRNLGFAGGHNQAYRQTDSEYFLLLNQDMYLQPNCLEKMAAFLDSYPTAAAVSPRLMKWNFAEQDFTNKIDALGLKIFRSRRVIEQYTGEAWSQARWPSAVLEVFGVSGALPMLRREAIKAAVYQDGTMFDELGRSYKEDVDLAYRLQAAKWQSFVLLDTAAWHDRRGAGPQELSDRAAAKNKQTQSSWVRYHSYKNHLATIYKNEYWQNTILDFPWIVWYELKKFVWLLLFDRRVLIGLNELWSSRKDLQAKRSQIKKLRRASWREMRRWW